MLCRNTWTYGQVLAEKRALYGGTMLDKIRVNERTCSTETNKPHTSAGTEEGSPVLRPMEVSQRTRAYHRLTLSKFSTASAGDNASRPSAGCSRCSSVRILPWMPAPTARHTIAEMVLC